MRARSRIAAGLVLALALMGFAGFKAYSKKLGPVVQAHGTTYYNGDAPAWGPVACKPERKILAAIKQVHAKYDHFSGAGLAAFEARAAQLKGLPPLNVEALYVVTEDDKLRNGDMVLFIGLRANCVTTVFGFPADVYNELADKSGGA
jgi:hypothetical protein